MCFKSVFVCLFILLGSVASGQGEDTVRVAQLLNNWAYDVMVESFADDSLKKTRSPVAEFFVLCGLLEGSKAADKEVAKVLGIEESRINEDLAHFLKLRRNLTVKLQLGWCSNANLSVVKRSILEDLQISLFPVKSNGSGFKKVNHHFDPYQEFISEEINPHFCLYPRLDDLVQKEHLAADASTLILGSAACVVDTWKDFKFLGVFSLERSINGKQVQLPMMVTRKVKEKTIKTGQIAGCRWYEFPLQNHTLTVIPVESLEQSRKVAQVLSETGISKTKTTWLEKDAEILLHAQYLSIDYDLESWYQMRGIPKSLEEGKILLRGPFARVEFRISERGLTLPSVRQIFQSKSAEPVVAKERELISFVFIIRDNEGLVVQIGRTIEAP